MKLIIFFTFYLSLILMCCSNNSTLKSNKKNGELINLDLNNDFGYLTKSEGITILDKIKMSEKTDKGWDIIKENDTIGKYFKSKETGNYIICLIDVQNKIEFETHVLIELKHIEKKLFNVVAKERYSHGNYTCCWSNNFSGFNQMENYFTFDYCGTGSEFCGSRTYYFKNVLPQDKLKNIPDNYSSSDGTSITTLTSTKHIKNDILTYNYRNENFEIIGEDNMVTKSVDTFSIVYKLKNNIWVCDDEKLERLQY